LRPFAPFLRQAPRGWTHHPGHNQSLHPGHNQSLSMFFRGGMSQVQAMLPIPR